MSAVSSETKTGHWYYGPHNNVCHFFNRVTVLQCESLCKSEFAAFSALASFPQQPETGPNAKAPGKCRICTRLSNEFLANKTIELSVIGKGANEFSLLLGAILDAETTEIIINGRHMVYGKGKDSILKQITHNGIFSDNKHTIEITTIDN